MAAASTGRGGHKVLPIHRHLHQVTWQDCCWSRGPRVQCLLYCFKVAAASVAEGLDHPDIVARSAIGSSGVCPSRCNGDLVSNLAKTTLREALYGFRLMYTLPGRALRSMIYTFHVLLLPSTTFDALRKHYPHVFKTAFSAATPVNPGSFGPASRHTHRVKAVFRLVDVTTPTSRSPCPRTETVSR